MIPTMSRAATEQDKWAVRLLFRDHGGCPPGHLFPEWTSAVEERIDVVPLRSALAQELTNSAWDDERRFAIKALGQLPATSEVVAAAAAALSDQLWDVRLDAATLLSALARPETQDVLMRALYDPHPIVRARAAEAVGRLDAWEAVDRLIDMLGERATQVRLSALGALREIAHAGLTIGGYRLVQREAITIRPRTAPWMPKPWRATNVLRWIEQLAVDDERVATGRAG